MRDQRTTDSVTASRADARAQADRRSEWMPYVPASSSPFRPDGVAADGLTWAETVAPGGYAHRVLARGSRLRFDDPTGDACAHLVLHDALAPWERLNVADTVKIPWQAYLGEGSPLLSGDGRILASIVEDDSGHHEPSAAPRPTRSTTGATADPRPRAPRRAAGRCS